MSTPTYNSVRETLYKYIVFTMFSLFFIGIAVFKLVLNHEEPIYVTKQNHLEIFYYTEKNNLPELVLMEIEEEDRKDGLVVNDYPTIPVDVSLLMPALPKRGVDKEKLPPPNKTLPTKRVSAEGILLEHTKGFNNDSISEIRCIAKNVFYESSREIFEGKIAVGNVTQKRKNSRFWKSTYCGVVKAGYHKPGQIGSCHFSWYCDGKKDEVYLYSKINDNGNIRYVLNHDIYRAWIDSIYVAIGIYKGTLDDVTGGATHYYNPSICYKNSVKIDGLCHPPWAAKGLKKGTIKLAESKYIEDGFIGNHLFLIELRAHNVVQAGF